MRAYFEKVKADGDMSNINFYSALQGFISMGFHVIEVDVIEKIPNEDNECVVVGSITFMQKVFKHFNIQNNGSIDYPASLKKYYGREIWASTINEIDSNPQKWNVFVKPKGLTKKFTGRVIQSTGDFIGTADQSFDIPIWVSNVVDFKREWRAYVRYGKILDVRPYKGDWKLHYDSAIVEKVIADYKDAPNGYAIDFGVTTDNRTLIVEVNDGYSIGSYGLFFTDYAKLLSARWAQLNNQKDLCDF